MPFTFSKLLVAIVILALGFTLGTLAGKFVRRIVVELELRRYFKFQIDLIAARVVAYLIYAISVILALINLGIATQILYAIIIILLVFMAAVVFLVLKDFIPNVMAGAMLERRALRKGQYIKFENISGKILEINATEAKIKSGREIIYVPNSLLWKHMLRVREVKRARSKKKYKVNLIL